MSEGVQEINKLLIDNYGMDVCLGLPKFRIVWTSSQFEKRYEKYSIYSEGGIFLREEEGVFEVPKYSGNFKDMWVLERLMSTEGNPYLEMVAKYSFEPVWIFGSARSSRQPVWRAVQLLVRNVLLGSGLKKSPKDLENEEEARWNAEKVRMKEMLSEDTSGLAVPLKVGSAVFLDGTRFRDKGAK